MDTARDEAHCGGCGKVCDKLCVGGTCDEVLELQSGGSHACARFASGALRCWGRSGNGQLGYGNTDNVGDKARPVVAVDLPGKVSHLGLGDDQTCVILEGGALYCWGNGFYGQLGLADYVSVGDDEAPTAYGAVKLGSTALSVAPSLYFTCAVLGDQSVRCWGATGVGRLGNPALAPLEYLGDDESPDQVSYNAVLGGKATQVSVGACHACAVMETGKLQCWGCNADGQLGRGTTAVIGDDETPESSGFLDLGSRIAVRVIAFSNSTCVLLDGGEVRCWGENGSGQLGYGHKKTLGDTADEVPSKLPAVPVGVNAADAVLDLSGGFDHVCALLGNGRVRCWGDALYGKLGYASTNPVGDNELPSTAGDVALGAKALQVVAGDQFSCARLDTGNVRCWGIHASGQLGYPINQNIGDDETPAAGEDVF